MKISNFFTKLTLFHFSIQFLENSHIICSVFYSFFHLSWGSQNGTDRIRKTIMETKWKLAPLHGKLHYDCIYYQLVVTQSIKKKN